MDSSNIHKASVNLNEEAFYDWFNSLDELGPLRVGQSFCNKFVEGPWPELYYETDSKVIWEMIEDFLDLHHGIQ